MKAPVKGKELKDSKVAAGMEVSFTIRFMPQEVGLVETYLVVVLLDMTRKCINRLL